MSKRRLGALCLMFWLAPFPSPAAFEESDPPVPTNQQDKRDPVYYPGDVESLKPFTRKLITNVWLDQKAIWTSPFHMTKEDAGWWAGLGAITAAAIVTDRRTTHLFENSAGQVTWGNQISDIGSVYTVVPAVAGFYFWGLAAHNQKARETSVLAGEALLDTLIVVEALKAAAGRNRPNAADRPGDFFVGGASFPSGHSIETWALASVIAHEYGNHKWVPWVSYGLASAVGTARFAARQHYASDVIAGSAMGYFIGRYVVNTHQAHAGHHRAALRPILQPSTGTYGVSVSVNLSEPLFRESPFFGRTSK